jgi:O-antigen chain-terminating methyltransferase
MIESANDGIDVDALMVRLRKRISEVRDRPQGHVPIDAFSLRSNVFVNSVEAYSNIADQKSQIRTQWPSNIGSTFPFSLPLVRIVSLKALAFLFKDQRHVNQALVMALREQVSLNRQLIEQIQILRDDVEALRARPCEADAVVER